MRHSLAGLDRSSRERRGAIMVMAAAGLLILVLWLSIVSVLMRSHRSAIDAETRVLERMTLVVEEQLRNQLSSVHAFLLNADEMFRFRPHADPLTDAQFLAMVSTLRGQSKDTIDVRAVSQEGDLYYLPGDRRQPLANVRDRSYFAVQSDPVLRGLFVGPPILGRASGRWTLPISYPLANAPGGMAVLFAAIESPGLNRLYEEGRTKPNGSIALVHRDGTVFARAPDGQSAAGKSVAGGEIWSRLLPAAPRGTAVLPATLIDARDRLTSYSAMSEFPLVVIASSSMEDILADWRRWLAFSVAFGVVTTLLTLFVAWRLVRLLAALAATRAQVEDQALRDPLTGLPNRRMFQDRLEQAIKKADRAGHAVALLFIDLDLFKEVNDTLGHSVGDLLLKDAATRLLSSVRQSDTIARLGGDEFTVIMSEAGPRSVERVAETVLARLSLPFQLGKDSAYISASIGITFYPQDAANAEELIKNADQAMYAAKSEGRNCFSYFTPSMQIAAQNRKRLLDDLRDALAREEFVLHYQPIVDLHTGYIAKAEALVRWRHPVRGLIGPAEFVPVLEETGLITDLGDWVFHQASNQVRKWRDQLDPEFQISINKSPAQFQRDTAAMPRWERHLDALGLPGRSISIEITEGLLMDINEMTATTLLQISRSGISLSLDDFGTGYSSLSYLKKFDIDTIKIDRTFVGSIDRDPNDVALCEAMIVMAHKLGLRVIAEGVENDAQRQLLMLIGCDYAQGYHFSEPIESDAFETLVLAVREQEPRRTLVPDIALSDR